MRPRARVRALCPVIYLIQAVREALARGEMSADAERRTQLAMPAGAICVFQGTLLHGGGANRTDTPRVSFTNQYCEPWARPQENFFLGVPVLPVLR